jgi:hypothetical protein
MNLDVMIHPPFKFGFIGQGRCPCTPPRTFLKKGSWNSKNFQKNIDKYIF